MADFLSKTQNLNSTGEKVDQCDPMGSISKLQKYTVSSVSTYLSHSARRGSVFICQG